MSLHFLPLSFPLEENSWEQSDIVGSLEMKQSDERLETKFEELQSPIQKGEEGAKEKELL